MVIKKWGSVTLKEKFNQLIPVQKNICVWAVVGASVLFIIVAEYKTSRAPVEEQAVRQEKPREITLEPDLIQKTMLREQRKKIEAIPSAE